ncbi:TonB-dependent receptor [Hymenobacter sp. BRD128]|uniref:TonB-dependent receptor n=1 Tax=Hymenobacter sp. BRD128 TaxID=2675878 RepID=UPI0015633F13|nr:TonB-dependent receptor [Hymenobacter sp. BRD128]QKG57660.1 TonB-dependent receptor [Hymenobacter sp. BRD128]
MLKTVLLAGTALLALVAAPARAQGSVAGQLTDAATGAALPGATVVLTDRPTIGTVTDANGRFVLPAVPAGAHTLQVRFVGFESISQLLQGQPEAQQLAPLALRTARNLTPEAVVTATRANERTATTYQNVSREQLQARNFGQDLPYLLDQTPSVVTTSDAGTGVGYTALRIRGTDGTRINVTLNGVPVNEAESHGVFFVDLPDLASSIQSIQVQRGAGPSTNGAGAFGASLNVETLGLRPKPYAEINNSAGSFGTWKTTVAAGTGLLNNYFTLDARASRVQSEGYIDRGWSRLKSLYLAGTYSDEKTLLRALVITGYETTYQAWYGLADSLLTKNRRYNEAGTDYGQHLPAYKNQTDNYQQDYYQFLISRQLAPSLNLSVTPFWTRGGGYYEEYKANQNFAMYGISGPVYQPRAGGGFDTLTTTDVIRRRWLKTDLYGATYALQLRPTAGGFLTEATLGGAVVGYRGQHYDELTWAQRGTNIPETGTPYYSEPNAHKLDVNTYLRATVALSEKLAAFGDVQFRHVAYELFAPDGSPGGGKSQQTINFNFLNPKGGLTYQVKDGLAAYASYALAQREPTRTDYTDTPAARRPTAEKLHNVEVGLRRTTGPFQWSANYYLMLYRDQLVLSGHLDDVGNPIHTNVRDSYRTGIELQATTVLWNKLTISPTATISRNKINNYTDYLADYDNGGERGTEFKQTDISFSPALTFAYTVEYELLPGLRLATLARYASRQYLDNTATASRSIPAYYVQDVRARYLWHPAKLGFREIELAAVLNNVLGATYVNNGYTYGYLSGGRAQYFSYYYPQARQHFLASVNLRW